MKISIGYGAASLLLALSACGSDEHSNHEHEEECGGHGHMHGSHCHCDSGYELDPDDGHNCVESEEEDDPISPSQSGRLLVADGASGKVVVVDLASGSAEASLTTSGAARVYSGSNGAWGFAVQTGSDAVQAIHPGLRYEDHGDHFDEVKSDPEIVGKAIISCGRPIHFVAHEGHAATFCDGDGILHVFDDTVTASSFEITAYDSGRAHHGVGLVAFEHILLSQPNAEDEEDALPIGVRVLGLGGKEEFVFSDCPKLHGEASTDEHVCFGCGDGVMCLSEESPGEIISEKLVSMEEAPEGVRVGNLVSGGNTLIGNWGEDFVQVDTDTRTLTPISFGEAYLQFDLTEDAQHLLVLADSGMFHKLRASDGEIVSSLALIPEFVREPGHGQLRPRFVVGSEHVYVVDPRDATVLEVDLESFTLSERVIELPDGEYHSLSLLALPPQ